MENQASVKKSDSSFMNFMKKRSTQKFVIVITFMLVPMILLVLFTYVPLVDMVKYSFEK